MQSLISFLPRQVLPSKPLAYTCGKKFVSTAQFQGEVGELPEGDSHLMKGAIWGFVSLISDRVPLMSSHAADNNAERYARKRRSMKKNIETNISIRKP